MYRYCRGIIWCLWTNSHNLTLLRYVSARVRNISTRHSIHVLKWFNITRRFAREKRINVFILIVNCEFLSEQQCPVCIGVFEATSECVRMPCKHHFHASCILPWLSKTNSCPVCRYELETDDANYESYRRQKVAITGFPTFIINTNTFLFRSAKNSANKTFKSCMTACLCDFSSLIRRPHA